MKPTDIINQQRSRNRQTINNWERSKPHRNRIYDLLSSHSGSALLRCFGAGNCNDLDLHALCEHYLELELVDIDVEAMESALTRQDIRHRSNICLIGQIDLSTGEFSSQRSADVTVSSCLFTQLLEQQAEHVVRDSPFVADYRQSHFDMLINTTKPGGTIYFITDIVSDLTARQLPEIPSTQLNGFLSKSVEKRNFFTGTNPFAIKQQLDADLRLAHSNLLDAWTWKLGPRTFAVYGFAITLRD